MLFEPEQTWLHEVISERENRRTSSAVYSSDNFGFSRCSPEEHISTNLKYLEYCIFNIFVDFKMFSGQILLCYNSGWVRQYVARENSEGKEIKIGF